MSALLIPFLLLAAFGLMTSIACHIASLFGVPFSDGSPVWGLHMGIFIVWLPTVLIASRMARYGKRSDFWRLALSGCPAWARYALYGLFAYAALNFVLGFFFTGGQSGSSGRPVVGHEVRLFSGHWMVFYGAALATLYSAVKNPLLLRDRKCVRGHDVSPLDQFCPKCGAPLEQISSMV